LYIFPAEDRARNQPGLEKRADCLGACIGRLAPLKAQKKKLTRNPVRLRIGRAGWMLHRLGGRTGGGCFGLPGSPAYRQRGIEGRGARSACAFLPDTVKLLPKVIPGAGPCIIAGAAAGLRHMRQTAL
jgi:hypothetical protein